MKRNPRLILASASARRARLLSEAGVEFTIAVPRVDESDCPRSVRETVQSNAKLKGEWAAQHFPRSAIIAADTAIDFEGDLIGKPENMTEARLQLCRFSAQTHCVLTGIFCSFPEEAIYSDVGVSHVTFRPLEDADIDRYFSLVDPLDKAGAYDIGSHGDIIVESHMGSTSNIIGLPMDLITPWLKEHGYLE